MILIKFCLGILSFCVLNLTAKASPTEIQFKKKIIVIKEQKIEVEIADDSAKQERGLMFRKSLASGKGMLFIFDYEGPLSFWMKNTYVPLSIAFFNQKRVLLNILDMEPVQSELQVKLPSYKSQGPAQYALEVPLGWFKKHKIKPGDRFDFVDESTNVEPSSK